ncbi:phenylacetic acid degradation protein [Longispora fulva]|uniref:Ring-1,2-phenylacetyl-CoA epoxidase subunit PaaC n=1 Tax=Longispora fulva TaxID=619741 RepID=A0A8J7GMY5_9ACTN|nr:1,2-phenylacetyl-CoA epoxidase subunit PaaC [Longispora fulva]MBG6140002.1 ring-1,2-phenylacetyl-CoA epoxidase subunit PaaC [Longispora fulva]GIG57619.1 phenylacetic acid degradation protein [Longispora fulva]
MNAELATADLNLGDDALIAAQRLAEWTSRAPELEEDVALANIALDLLGQARMFLSRAGDEDELAFLRTDRQFTNVQLVELPNGDFAHAIVRLLFFSAYQRELYTAMAGDEIADKAIKEVDYHVDHARLWTLRLGDGTDESHARAQAAVDELWPYTHELFEGNDLRAGWLAAVEPVLAEATLTRPEDGWAPTGGRQGLHTTHLSYLLAEMQVLHRAHPGATW